MSSCPRKSGAWRARIAGLAIAAGLICAPAAAREAPARAPLGWEASDSAPGCWLQAHATVPGNRQPWRIRLGHVPQHASLFFVALAHPGLAGGRLATPVRAWVALDGVAVPAAGVSLSGGELLVPVVYQRAWVERLAGARSLAVILESGPWARRTVLTRVPIGNTGAAMEWLEGCRRSSGR